MAKENDSLKNLIDRTTEVVKKVDEITKEDSSVSSDDKYNTSRNTGWGKQNPFADEFGVQKEGDSDQIQLSYTDTGSGWLPAWTANNKQRIKLSIWDNMEVPGSAFPGRDREQTPGELAGGMGNPLSRNNSDIAQYERLISVPSREFLRRERGEGAIVDETDDSKDDDHEIEPKKLVPASNKHIIKISSDDDYWMNECLKQISTVRYDYINALNNKYSDGWRLMTPAIKDGNTLRVQWVRGSGLKMKKFLLYIRYNAGMDTYSVSSSFYDSTTNEEKTLQGWQDDVYIDQLMDPIIWI